MPLFMLPFPVLRRGHGLGVYLAELRLIREANEAEEWVDQSQCIPL